MRALVAVTAAAGLVAGSCGGAGSDNDAAMDRFCAGFASYRGAVEALREIPLPDPRRLVDLLASVEAPPELAPAWTAWQERERTIIAADAARASHGRAPFWIVTPPDQEPSEVDAVWEEECVAARGQEVQVMVSETDPELPPFSEAPDGGEIRVVEHGFTAATGSDCCDEYEVVSYGVVVENTSGYVAVGTTVQVRMVDESGRQVRPRGSGGMVAEHTIPVLRPGQRFGVGRERYVDRPGTVALEVTIGETAEWAPASHAVIALNGITVANPEIHPYHGGGLFVRFRIDSRYRVRSGGLVSSFPYRTAGTPYLVLRNTEGTIVGGADTSEQWDVPPGHSEGAVVINQVPILELGSDVDPYLVGVYF